MDLHLSVPVCLRAPRYRRPYRHFPLPAPLRPISADLQAKHHRGPSEISLRLILDLRGFRQSVAPRVRWITRLANEGSRRSASLAPLALRASISSVSHALNLVRCSGLSRAAFIQTPLPNCPTHAQAREPQDDGAVFNLGVVPLSVELRPNASR